MNAADIQRVTCLGSGTIREEITAWRDRMLIAQLREQGETVTESEKPGGPYGLPGFLRIYMSRRPSRARRRVASSATSRWLPTGMP